MKMNKSDKVYYVVVKLNDYLEVFESYINEHEVLAVNENNAVVNDDNFTTLQLVKNDDYNMHQVLNNLSVYEETSKSLKGIMGSIRMYGFMTTNNLSELESELNEAINMHFISKISSYGTPYKVEIKLNEMRG